MQALTLFGTTQEAQSEGNSLASLHVCPPTLPIASYWPVSPHSQSWEEELAEVRAEMGMALSHWELTLTANLDAQGRRRESPLAFDDECEFAVLDLLSGYFLL